MRKKLIVTLSAFIFVALLAFSAIFWRTQETQKGVVIDKIYHQPRYEYNFPDYSRPYIGDHNIIGYRTYVPEEFYLAVESQDGVVVVNTYASQYYYAEKGDSIYFNKYKSKLFGFVEYYTSGNFINK